MPDAPDQLREKRVELILQQLEAVPSLSPVEIAFATGTSDAIEQLHADQELTQRVLKLSHAIEHAGPRAMETIESIATRRGIDAIRHAVLCTAAYQTLSATTSKSAHWQHAIAVGCCAELLAEQMVNMWGKDSGLDPFEAFAGGFLHDIGKLVLETVLPKSFARAVEAVEMLRGNIADIERTVIGLDHLVAGKRLAESWALPPAIRDCIWLHGQTPQALPATVARPRLVNLITLADVLVREQHLGYSGNYLFPIPRQSLVDAVGVSAEQVDAVIGSLIEHIEPHASALGIGETAPTQIFQGAIAQANKELDRVQTDLAAKNRRLQLRQRFFEALSGFQGEMRPDAPPQSVLRAIGQTAVSLLDVTSAAAFSLIPGQEFAEVLLFDHNGDVFETSLVDCPQRPPTPAGGEGPVLPAAAELEWLLSAISPRLAHEQRFWICLEADGQCVGGVLWGSLPGESQRLGPQVQEIVAIAAGWALALRTAQIREEAKTLAEQLAEVNRKLQSAQAEILRSRTIITVGEMAAGAAHEMNNPLAVISGRSQLLSQQLSDPKHKAAAHLIHEQAHRLTDIITELMDFAKPVPPQVGECDLPDLIDRALHEAKMQADVVDRTVEVTIGDVPAVIVDKEQVMKALMELFDNAFNATDPVKGHIAVHAAFDPFSRKVAVTISDNGCGMDQSTLKRAFDPFFSMRPAGRRRGMGLAKALRWVEASGGSIRLESRQGHGTRSLVLLPAAQPSAQQAKKAPRRAAQ
jgi:signal transduction histidine kinase/HD-like signal output (HDOD) protein